MAAQSFKNYRRFYASHHFVFYPLASVLLGFALYFAITSHDWLLWIFIAIILSMMIWLSYMMRQHYALTLQDRIIRMEMRYRCYVLTDKHPEDLHPPLRDSQLFALRFASDEEFPELLNRIQNENLSGRRIKEGILNWKPDNNRV